MGNTMVRQSIVNPQTALNGSQIAEQVSFFATDGTPLFMVSALPTPANQLLTGYVIAASKLSLLTTDSVLVALGKLEKRLALGSL